MNTATAIGWELRRILLTRTYLYSLLLIILFSQNALGRLIINGTYGSAPYSPLSYAQFLVLLNPLLLSVLMLWCGAVFSERERAVRRIVLATPITGAGYLGIKAAAIALRLPAYHRADGRRQLRVLRPAIRVLRLPSIRQSARAVLASAGDLRPGTVPGCRRPAPAARAWPCPTGLLHRHHESASSRCGSTSPRTTSCSITRRS